MKFFRITQKRKRLFLFVFLTSIVSLGLGFGILIFGLKEGVKGLEQFYLLLFAVLTLVLVMLILGIVLFLILALEFPIFQKKDILDFNITLGEIVKISDEDKKKMLKELANKKNEIQYMIEFAKKKYYQRKLDEESFRELIRDHEKKLIEIELKIKEIKDYYIYKKKEG